LKGIGVMTSCGKGMTKNEITCEKQTNEEAMRQLVQSGQRKTKWGHRVGCGGDVVWRDLDWGMDDAVQWRIGREPVEDWIKDEHKPAVGPINLSLLSPTTTSTTMPMINERVFCSESSTSTISPMDV
jgi:hypothetical protein